MTPVKINYQSAKLLSDDHEDVLVFEPSSGSCFKFSSLTWSYQGNEKMPYEEVISQLGTGALDDHYIFIWMNSI